MSKNLDQYVVLLRKLHQLHKEGKDDLAEADAIRDAMDEVFYELNPSEIELVDKLSIELYKEA